MAAPEDAARGDPAVERGPAGEPHHQQKVAAAQEGISVRNWTARVLRYYFANAGQ